MDREPAQTTVPHSPTPHLGAEREGPLLRSLPETRFPQFLHHEEHSLSLPPTHSQLGEPRGLLGRLLAGPVREGGDDALPMAEQVNL